MGFPRHLYDRVASAGDDAREALLERSEPAYRNLGTRCLLLARPGEDRLAAGLGLTLVGSAEAADFLFVMSMDPDSQSVAGWKPVLEQALRRDLDNMIDQCRHGTVADCRIIEALSPATTRV